MDSMIVWDRRRCDARYDLNLTNMTDLELLMQLWRTAGTTFHLGKAAARLRQARQVDEQRGWASPKR